MELLIFDDPGGILERCRLVPSDTRAVEIPSGAWRSYVCCQPRTIALEVKQGAYVPTGAGDLAPWATAENAPACKDFLSWMRTAPAGSEFG